MYHWDGDRPVTNKGQSGTWRNRAIGRDGALVRSENGITMAFALGPAMGEIEKTKRLQMVLEALRGDLDSLCFCRQIHGSLVHLITKVSGRVVRVGDGDALATSTPGLGLLVWTADCVPILLAGEGAVAAVHSGWRGCAADVVGAAVSELENGHGLTPHDLRAAIGPAVCGGCYQVGNEVVRALQLFDIDETRWLDGDRVDLRGFLSARLEALGVPAERIEMVGGCTVETDDLASFRRDGEAAGRQWSMVYLRS